MAQHDYSIANQSGQAFRADLNNALAAIVSGNSGASEPSTTFAYQYWVDTSTTPATLKQRNSSNNAWITIGQLDTANLGLIPAGSASIVNADVNASAGITAGKLRFTQVGTGATARTVDSKLKDVVSVKDFGAVGDGVTNDTAAIQAAIAYAGAYTPATLVFPGGAYAVTQLTFNNFYTTYVFDQAQIVPFGTTAVTALVNITNREQTFYGMQINGGYLTHFTAALRIHSVSGSGYWPGFVRMYDLNILSAKIGILYGAITSPVDAPVSENTIDGYTTRGVERPIYLNQPNGFLNLTNSVLDCGAAEDPTWSATTACCIENVNCILKVSNSELIKVASGVGYGIKNSSVLNISNCDSEIPATQFLLNNGSITFIDNWHTYFWANATTWFFESASNATAKLFVNNLNYTKAAANAGGGNGLLKTNGTTGLVAYFTNCLFSNQIGDSLLTSDFRSRWTDADVQFFNCYVDNASGSKYLPISTTENVARYYSIPATGKYNLTVGAPATITVGAVNEPNCKNALIFTGSAGVNCIATTKVGIDQSIQVQKKLHVLSMSMSASATSPNIFSANLTVTYYDNAGNTISTQILGEGDGSVGHLQAISGTQAWRNIRRVLDVPLLCSELQIYFSLNTTAVWRVGNITVA